MPSLNPLVLTQWLMKQTKSNSIELVENINHNSNNDRDHDESKEDDALSYFEKLAND